MSVTQKITVWYLDNIPPALNFWIFKTNHLQGDGKHYSCFKNHFLTLRFVYAGTGKISIDGRKFTIRAGECFFAQPGILLELIESAEHKWSWYEIQFIGSHLTDIPEAFGNNNNADTFTFADTQLAIKEFSEFLLLHAQKQKSPYTLMSRFYTLLAALAPSNTLTAPINPQRQLVHKAQNILKSHLPSNLNANELSDILGVHRSTLRRAFTAEFGITTIEYLQKLRLEHAKELLLLTSMTLEEIAGNTGFANKNYLISSFRKYMGVTPAQWRSQTIAKALKDESESTG